MVSAAKYKQNAVRFKTWPEMWTAFADYSRAGGRWTRDSLFPIKQKRSCCKCWLFACALKISLDLFAECDGHLHPDKPVEASFDAKEGGCLSLGAIADQEMVGGPLGYSLRDMAELKHHRRRNPRSTPKGRKSVSLPLQLHFESPFPQMPWQ